MIILKSWFFFFLLEQKETKIQEKVIGSRTGSHSPRYLFWLARSSNFILCGARGVNEKCEPQVL
jgi:hypothetical protein